MTIIGRISTNALATIPTSPWKHPATGEMRHYVEAEVFGIEFEYYNTRNVKSCYVEGVDGWEKISNSKSGLWLTKIWITDGTLHISSTSETVIAHFTRVLDALNAANVDEYFTAKAEEVVADAGAPDADTTAIAVWAQAAKLKGDRKRGIMITTDGTIIAEARRAENNRYYVSAADAKKFNLDSELVTNILMPLKKQLGQDLLLLGYSDLCEGAGRR